MRRIGARINRRAAALLAARNGEAPVILYEAERRNLFMKKLMRERVAPTIAATVSWLTFPIIGGGASRRNKAG